jgi:hypothetical protein
VVRGIEIEMETEELRCSHCGKDIEDVEDALEHFDSCTIIEDSERKTENGSGNE